MGNKNFSLLGRLGTEADTADSFLEVVLDLEVLELVFIEASHDVGEHGSEPFVLWLVGQLVLLGFFVDTFISLFRI